MRQQISATPEHADREVQETDHGNLQILIAEDDDPLRESLVQLFETLGFTAIGAATGDEFFEWLQPRILGDQKHWRPDVIVTDVNMPGIPPLEVVDGLRRVGRDVPAVVVSGMNAPSIRSAVRSMGFIWLDKPLDPYALEDAVRRTLAESFERITIDDG